MLKLQRLEILHQKAPFWMTQTTQITRITLNNIFNPTTQAEETRTQKMIRGNCKQKGRGICHL